MHDSRTMREQHARKGARARTLREQSSAGFYRRRLQTPCTLRNLYCSFMITRAYTHARGVLSATATIAGLGLLRPIMPSVTQSTKRQKEKMSFPYVCRKLSGRARSYTHAETHAKCCGAGWRGAARCAIANTSPRENENYFVALSMKTLSTGAYSKTFARHSIPVTGLTATTHDSGPLSSVPCYLIVQPLPPLDSSNLEARTAIGLVSLLQVPLSII